MVEYIGPGLWSWAAFLFAAGVCLTGLASVVYVAFRFLSLVVSMEAGILREFKGNSKAVDKALADIPQKEAKLREFIAARMSPTEGEFVPQSDEEAFINEQVEHLRRQGMTDDELDAFVRQAVNTDIGSPENNG
jgi:hypothetical protein